jgi:glucosamine-6-phosphate deaminase
MKAFSFVPSQWVPFRDQKVIERVRKIKREDIARHPNPRLKIRVVPDSEIGHLWVTDVFYRIMQAAEEGRKCVLIMPNPARAYRLVAHMINKFRVPCRHVHCFIMDEYADQDGNVAPPTWPLGFMYSFRKFFYEAIDRKLRPPEKQIVGPTNRNVKDYGRMITDMGGGTACYTGPGWTGHLAFIEPDAPEFDAPLAEWRRMGPRIVTLSPFTIAQNSLHGFFGRSGDLAAVPPRAFTIGPAQVIESKYRMDMHSLTVAGTPVSWQRFITRLILHGPVSPRVPTSIHQELASDVYVSETAAQNIEPHWDFEY